MLKKIKVKNINLNFSYHASDFDYLTSEFQISGQGTRCLFLLFYLYCSKYQRSTPNQKDVDLEHLYLNFPSHKGNMTRNSFLGI